MIEVVLCVEILRRANMVVFWLYVGMHALPSALISMQPCCTTMSSVCCSDTIIGFEIVNAYDLRIEH